MAHERAEPHPPRLSEDREPADSAHLEDDSEWVRVDVAGDFTAQSASRVEFEECLLAGAHLVGAELDRVRMTDTRLERCDLSGAVFEEASLSRVEFRECRLTGANLAGARVKDVRFVQCKLDDANLRMITGERIEFDDSVLRRADLYGASLKAARFFDCDLTAVEFSRAELGGARLHGSTLDDARGADGLRGVVIDSMQVMPLALRVFATLGITVDDERDAAQPV